MSSRFIYFFVRTFVHKKMPLLTGTFSDFHMDSDSSADVPGQQARTAEAVREFVIRHHSQFFRTVSTNPTKTRSSAAGCRSCFCGQRKLLPRPRRSALWCSDKYSLHGYRLLWLLFFPEYSRHSSMSYDTLAGEVSFRLTLLISATNPPEIDFFRIWISSHLKEQVFSAGKNDLNCSMPCSPSFHSVSADKFVRPLLL